MQIRDHFNEAYELLRQFLSDEGNMARIEEAGLTMVRTIVGGGKIISCGNGGSMCDAMHFAEELSGRYKENRSPLPAVSISDPSHLSCVANDYGFDYVFSRYIEAVGKPEDTLLAISTSGNSANVIKAIEAAKGIGMKCIGLTGKNGGKIADMVDIEIRAPRSEYADRAQEIHIKVIHTLIDFIETQLAL